MGRRSKASQARLDNLCKASLKSYKATVEDASDSDGDDTGYNPHIETDHDDLDFDNTIETSQGLENIQGRFIFLEDDFDDSDSDLDSVSDSDSEEMELDDDEEVELRDEAALLAFTEVLQKAQIVAADAENKKWGERKRPKRYTRNAARSLRRHVATRQKLANDGQKFINHFFKASEKGRDSPEPIGMVSDSESNKSSSEDSPEHESAPVSLIEVSSSPLSDRFIAYQNDRTLKKRKKNLQTRSPKIETIQSWFLQLLKSVLSIKSAWHSCLLTSEKANAHRILTMAAIMDQIPH